MKADHPIKILMSTDTLGGVWTYAVELMESLKDQDVSFTLATMGRATDKYQQQQVARLENVELVESEYKLEWMDQPWGEVERAGNWLLKLEEQHAPDVIHLNGYAHAGYPFRAPEIVVAHSDVYSWWHAVKGGQPPEKYAEYFRRVSDGLRRADVVIAPTADMLRSLSRHYRVPRRQMVIPNARNPARFHAGRKEPYILSIGRIWDEAKNIRVLETIAGKTLWPVYIAGEDLEPGARANRKFRELHFLGKLPEEDIAKWLSRASIYVMPALYEPFGLSILEAALSGCALVLGDIGSLRENWDEAAVFVNPKNPEDVKKGIVKLQNEPGLRAALSRAARSRALRFSPQKMASEYGRIYSRLISGARQNLPVS